MDENNEKQKEAFLREQCFKEQLRRKKLNMETT